MDPESVSFGAISLNPAKLIRVRFWQVHRQGKRHRDDLLPVNAAGELHAVRGERSHVFEKNRNHLKSQRLNRIASNPDRTSRR